MSPGAQARSQSAHILSVATLTAVSECPSTHTNRMASLAALFGFHREAAGAPVLPGVVPPTRHAVTTMTDRAALAIDSVYRAVTVLQAAGKQLSLDVWRDGTQLEGTDVPTIIASPGPDLTVTALIAETISSLAVRGNAYWLIGRDRDGRANSLRVLNPTECLPVLDARTGARSVQWSGRTWQPTDLRHLRLTYVPGEAEGLGPIQACARALQGAADMAAYASQWTHSGGVPTGVLSTDQPITAQQATDAKKAWNESNSTDGGVAVIGAGLRYSPLHLTPSEVQFLESRAFDVLSVGRMFGIPAHMLLASVNGTSMTYQNVTDAATDFVRWTLMAYLREIEDTLTAILPRRTIVRFNLDALLRANAAARMTTHRTAIEAGIYSAEYARRIEGITDPTATPKDQAHE